MSMDSSLKPQRTTDRSNDCHNQEALVRKTTKRRAKLAVVESTRENMFSLPGVGTMMDPISLFEDEEL